MFEEIRKDILAGDVFPALRENEIHLYHEGGRVLRIRPKSAYTHERYSEGRGDGEKSLYPLTKHKYEEIKAAVKCRNSKPLAGRDDQYREAWIVSRLFKRFSAWSSQADKTQPRLIDIEVRFRRDKNTCKPQMIDLLFLRNEGRLTFVEVKRQYDSRVRSRSKDDPRRSSNRSATTKLRSARIAIVSCGPTVRSALFWTPHSGWSVVSKHQRRSSVAYLHSCAAATTSRVATHGFGGTFRFPPRARSITVTCSSMAARFAKVPIGTGGIPHGARTAYGKN